MFTLEEFRDEVMGLKSDYKMHLPVRFWEDIASYWFSVVFPKKNENYGVEGLQRLGAIHTVAEFVGCHYRWRRMDEQGHSFTYNPMMNAILDAFGYSILMRVLAQAGVSWEQAGLKKKPHKDVDTLLEMYWDNFIPPNVGAVTIATRCTLNMWKGTIGA